MQRVMHWLCGVYVTFSNGVWSLCEMHLKRKVVPSSMWIRWQKTRVMLETDGNAIKAAFGCSIQILKINEH